MEGLAPMKNLILILLLISCGQVDTNEPSSSSVSNEKSQIDTKTTEPRLDVSKAYYMESLEDLGKCEEKTHKTLVYIETEGAFYVCSATLNEWKIVSIKGENGKDGADGLKGSEGTKGDKGDAGEKGERGEAGEEGDKLITAIYECPTGYAGTTTVSWARAILYETGHKTIEAHFRTSYMRGESCAATQSNVSTVSCLIDLGVSPQETRYVSFNAVTEKATYGSTGGSSPTSQQYSCIKISH